ncbi:MAG: ATP synthase F1 subunit gamma [Bacteroidetes bacterium]|nr:ATP synthase F1 subunit gamma [Bacteroidota bacterium]
MAANLKEVRIRIKSVISTQQITKAMKMVSAAKLRKATDRIWQIRPYSGHLSTILSNILTSLGSEVELDYGKERELQKALIVVVTSDRGLCGAFNSNSVKATRALIAEKYEELSTEGRLEVMFVGKKGFDLLKKDLQKANDKFLDLFHNLNFDDAAYAAEYIMDGYLRGEYDRVDVVYGKFKNAAVQLTTVEQFLPVAAESSEEDSGSQSDYIFEPDQKEILDELIPKILKTQFFRYLLDSNASEHGARMTAMDAATDNAEELLKGLKLSYNRARQAAITTEISEIVSGAAALEG